MNSWYERLKSLSGVISGLFLIIIGAVVMYAGIDTDSQTLLIIASLGWLIGGVLLGWHSHRLWYFHGER